MCLFHLFLPFVFRNTVWYKVQSTDQFPSFQLFFTAIFFLKIICESVLKQLLLRQRETINCCFNRFYRLMQKRSVVAPLILKVVVVFQQSSFNFVFAFKVALIFITNLRELSLDRNQMNWINKFFQNACDHFYKGLCANVSFWFCHNKITRSLLCWRKKTWFALERRKFIVIFFYVTYRYNNIV